MRAFHLAVLIVAAVTSGACAARSGGSSVPTPRPFPGAPAPPTANAPAPARVDPPTPPAPLAVPAPPAPEAPHALVDAALTFLGTPYRFAGSDPSGFDCSGFVQYVFSRLGIALPREVRDQYRVGENVGFSEVQPGDLIFFQTVAEGASHVGLAIGRDQFVHAPSSRGVVRVERYTTPYWASRFVGARRINAPSLSDRRTAQGSVQSSQ